jgi:uncharacterized protein YceK
MKHTQSILRIFLFTIILAALSGCGSTSTEHGVTIEKQGGNPLKFW